MGRWHVLLTLMVMLTAVSQAQQNPLTIQWLSRGANLSGQPADSRFPSISADGKTVVFQVGNGQGAQIWQASATNQWQTAPVTVSGTNLLGIHPVISADGNHIAFASWKDYRPSNQPPFPDLPKTQIYVYDYLQNRIVPISFLWQDTDSDGFRDTFVPSLGNCVPVAISANGRIVVFLAQSPDGLNVVDENGDGVPEPVNNPPSGWLVLTHDRDADGNGVYDEAGIGATRTFVGSLDSTGNPLLAASVSVAANGRLFAFTTPDPTNSVNWHVFIRDWQTGVGYYVSDSNGNFVFALAPALSDDGTYLAYLTPTQIDNDGDGQLNEDPIDGQDNDNDGRMDEDPPELYWQTTMDLVVRQLVDPATGQPPAQPRELRLSGLPLPPQTGTADGTAGWGYSDWWGAITLATDPTNPNTVYATFHTWATDLIDLQNVSLNPKVNFYQGVPNIFLAKFDFTPQAPNQIQLWRLTEWTDQQQENKRRGLPVSLQLSQLLQQYRLTLAPNLMPAVSFVSGHQLAIAFQSLANLDLDDKNGLWDIYLATVTLPSQP